MNESHQNNPKQYLENNLIFYLKTPCSNCKSHFTNTTSCYAVKDEMRFCLNCYVTLKPVCTLKIIYLNCNEIFRKWICTIWGANKDESLFITSPNVTTEEMKNFLRYLFNKPDLPKINGKCPQATDEFVESIKLNKIKKDEKAKKEKYIYCRLVFDDSFIEINDDNFTEINNTQKLN